MLATSFTYCDIVIFRSFGLIYVLINRFLGILWVSDVRKKKEIRKLATSFTFCDIVIFRSLGLIYVL